MSDSSDPLREYAKGILAGPSFGEDGPSSLMPDSDALNGAVVRAVGEAKSTAPPSVLAP